MIRRLIYVCNALDDDTRNKREITTDSPAASRKIFSTCIALRRVGVKAVVLSTGRGRARASWRYDPGHVRRIRRVPVIYMPFVSLRVVSELLSTFSLAWWVLRLHRKAGRKAYLFYNRMSVYILPLLVVVGLREERILDLEDGNLKEHPSISSATSAAFRTFVFRTLCSRGTVLANTALGREDVIGPTFCFYGVTAVKSSVPDWSVSPINVLIGGTVAVETGADLLLAAMRQLRTTGHSWSAHFQLLVTGKGDYIEKFRMMGEEQGVPRVKVFGRLDDDAYDEVLASAHVGLALKPNLGALADTTFPSKVVEMAGAGLLVVTTNISDVKRVLGDGALYLSDDDPEALIAILKWIVENPQVAMERGRQATLQVQRLCEVEQAGAALSTFLFA